MSSLIERLPSKNKSFSAAQILTVTELLERGSALSRPNSSVRTTGILVSHDVAGSFIRIRDPLWKKDKQTPKRNDEIGNNVLEKRYSYSTPELSKPKQPLRQNEESSNQKILITEFKTPNSSGRTNPTPSLSSSLSSSVHNPYLKNLSSTKRKLGYGGKLGGTNNSSAKPVRKIVSIKKKQRTSLLDRSRKNLITSTRNWSTSKKMNLNSDLNAATKSNFFTPRSKQGRISTQLTSHSPSFPDTLIVDVSSVSPLSNIKVGDLIMIMGCTKIITDKSNYEIKDTKNETKQPNRDHFFSSDKNISRRIDIGVPHSSIKQAILQCNEDEKIDSLCNEKTRNEAGIRFQGGYLEARIVNNVNGTNISLFNQALFLRRQYFGL